MARRIPIILGGGLDVCKTGRMRAELLATDGTMVTLKPLRIVGERNEEGRRTVILAEAGDAVPVGQLRGRATDEHGTPGSKAGT